MNVERVPDVKAELGESPVWDPLLACLYFVDVVDGRIHCYDPATHEDLYITTAAIALAPAERACQPLAGGLLQCRPGPCGRPPRRFQG